MNEMKSLRHACINEYRISTRILKAAVTTTSGWRVSLGHVTPQRCSYSSELSPLLHHFGRFANPVDFVS